MNANYNANLLSFFYPTRVVLYIDAHVASVCVAVDEVIAVHDVALDLLFERYGRPGGTPLPVPVLPALAPPPPPRDPPTWAPFPRRPR